MARREREKQVEYHQRRLDELKNVRKPWESAWQACADFIEPTRLRLSSRAEGPISREKIVDSTATLAHRTLSSGMHSGITSPARPWFRLAPRDREMRDYAPAKEYTNYTETLMRSVFNRSNLYPTFHLGYGDQGLFGQSCALLVEHPTDVIRLQRVQHGRFWIARDHTGRATTLYREFRWSIQRIIDRFGLENVSSRVRTAYDTSKYDECITICHAIEPRSTREVGNPSKRHKRFSSNYWEADSHEGKLLEESGFDSNPIIAPAWEISADDHYALSPGQIALGDVKMLQTEQMRKLEGIDKKVRPPMTGPTSMRNNPRSLLPGSVTFVDDPTGKGYRPAMEVNFQLSELMADIRETQQRIDRAFYADLFLMLQNMDGIQPRNVMEIAERKEEKLLALGPVLENIYNDQLEVVIDRTYEILNERGELPPPPVELQNQDLEIEYISVLAQAQKAVSTGAVERGLSFLGNLAAVKPQAADKLDEDKTVDAYFDMIGVPPDIVRSRDDVDKDRQERAEQQQQQAAMQQMVSIAPAAKDGAEAARILSDGDSGGGSAAELLSRLGIAG
ncbi:portal protein [Breoghania sp.]|uniref:portal protein n=1 Tax=Breoghania sp. TaxID=2065378 RepID=UPI002AA6E2E2|nr:portal protein [Breoghania sp.]